MAGVAGRSGRKAFVPNPDQRHIVRAWQFAALPVATPRLSYVLLKVLTIWR